MGDSSAAEGATGAARTRPQGYAAFLSYSHVDKRAAAKLHGFLENYRIPNAIVVALLAAAATGFYAGRKR